MLISELQFSGPGAPRLCQIACVLSGQLQTASTTYLRQICNLNRRDFRRKLDPLQKIYL